MDAEVVADLKRRVAEVQAKVALALGSGLPADLEAAEEAAAGLRWALVCALAPRAGCCP